MPMETSDSPRARVRGVSEPPTIGAGTELRFIASAVSVCSSLSCLHHHPLFFVVCLFVLWVHYIGSGT